MKHISKVVAGLGVLLLIVVFVLNTGKGVKIAWTEADYSSGIAKTGIKIDDMNSINLASLATGSFQTKGKVNVNSSFTSAEVTALIAKANATSGPIKDVAVKFSGDNQGEVSFKISEAFIKTIKEEDLIRKFLQKGEQRCPGNLEELVLTILIETASIGLHRVDLTEFTVDLLSSLAANKPIYARGSLERFSANSVTIDIQEVRVGQIPLPQATLQTIEHYVGVFISTLISPQNGFNIQELRVEDGQLLYKGTMPAEIRGVKLP